MSSPAFVDNPDNRPDFKPVELYARHDISMPEDITSDIRGAMNEQLDQLAKARSIDRFPYLCKEHYEYVAGTEIQMFTIHRLYRVHR